MPLAARGRDRETKGSGWSSRAPLEKFQGDSQMCPNVPLFQTQNPIIGGKKHLPPPEKKSCDPSCVCHGENQSRSFPASESTPSARPFELGVARGRKRDVLRGVKSLWHHSRTLLSFHHLSTRSEHPSPLLQWTEIGLWGSPFHPDHQGSRIGERLMSAISKAEGQRKLSQILTAKRKQVRVRLFSATTAVCSLISPCFDLL